MADSIVRGFSATPSAVTGIPVSIGNGKFGNLTIGSGLTLTGTTLTSTGGSGSTTGTSILAGNGSGGFANVTIGSGLSFSGGVLSSSGASGVSSFNGRTGAVSLLQVDVTTALTSSIPANLSYSMSSASGESSCVHITKNNTFGSSGSGISAALWLDVTTQSTNTTYDWGFISRMHSYNPRSTGSENVAGYLQQNKHANGAAWAAVAELCDLTNANAVSGDGGSVGFEVDVWCNGTDTVQSRIGIDIVVGNAQAIRNLGPGISGGEAYAGIRVGSMNGNASSGWFRNGLVLNSGTNAGIVVNNSGTVGIKFTGSNTTGIDTTGGTFTGNAIQLGAAQGLGWEATAQIVTKWNQSAGYIEFWNGGTRRGYINLYSGLDVQMNSSGGGGSYVDLTSNQSISGVKTFSGLATTLSSTVIGTPSGTFGNIYGWGGGNAKAFTDNTTLAWDNICQVNFISGFLGGSYSATNIENVLRPLYCVVSEMQALLLARGIY